MYKNYIGKIKTQDEVQWRSDVQLRRKHSIKPFSDKGRLGNESAPCKVCTTNQLLVPKSEDSNSFSLQGTLMAGHVPQQELVTEDLQ